MPLSIISFFTYNKGLTSNHDVRPFFHKWYFQPQQKAHRSLTMYQFVKSKHTISQNVPFLCYYLFNYLHIIILFPNFAPNKY